MKNIAFAACCLLLASCTHGQGDLPSSVGERSSGFGYVPLDPLPVNDQGGANCRTRSRSAETPHNYKDLLDSLPDNAVRIAVAKYEANGGLSYGPVTVGTKNNDYQVILDYINVDTANILFELGRFDPVSGEVRSIFDIGVASNPNARVYARRIVQLNAEDWGLVTREVRKIHKETDLVNIPVYVGVGLRMTANIHVTKSGVKLTSLGAIAAEAEKNNVTGTLVVQTLGITGTQVSTTLPMPSELNETTVQNVILALGSIKAIVPDTRATRLAPRVTGIYNPLGSGDARLVNSIVSELARQPVEWPRPCKEPAIEPARP